MAKQINQYTKTRTSGTIQNDDYLDFDSTEDAGSTFESAKLKVSEFLTYLISNIPTFFTSDGAITSTRNVEMNGFNAEFENGKLVSKANLNDVGYLLQDSLSAEKGSFAYDVGLDTATLELKNVDGTYVKAIDGAVGVGRGMTNPSATFDIYGFDVNSIDHLRVSRGVNDAFIVGFDAGGFPQIKLYNDLGAVTTFINGNASGVSSIGSSLGIGTALPTAKLHVDGSVRLSSLTTTPAAGYLLQSVDADGNLDWVAPSSGASKYSQQFDASLETLGVAKTITHSLNSTSIIVQLWDDVTGAVIEADYTNRLVNSVDVTFNGSLPSGNVTIIILG